MHTEEAKNITEQLEQLDEQCRVGMGRVRKINADIAEADDESIIEDLEEQKQRALIGLQSQLTQMEALFRQVGIDP